MIGLEVHEGYRQHPQQPKQYYHDVRSKMICSCEWPNKWTFKESQLQDGHEVNLYTCDEVSKFNNITMSI